MLLLPAIRRLPSFDWLLHAKLGLVLLSVYIFVVTSSRFSGCASLPPSSSSIESFGFTLGGSLFAITTPFSIIFKLQTYSEVVSVLYRSICVNSAAFFRLCCPWQQPCLGTDLNQLRKLATMEQQSILGGLQSPQALNRIFSSTSTTTWLRSSCESANWSF